jgi:hypothetical protein
VCDRNQQTVSHATSLALSALVGYDWGQHGDVMYFVQGAYRRDDGGVKTFQ